jgi:hypothetical protein
MDRFEELLKELSIELGATFHPDKRGACKIRINETLDVQIECDPSQEKLLVATFIYEIPPGKFRENILKDALKSNAPFPINGTLSYSERNNQLALFSFLNLPNLNGKTLAEFILEMIEKANQWRQGIQSGNTSQLVATQTKASGSIFGLK